MRCKQRIVEFEYYIYGDDNKPVWMKGYLPIANIGDYVVNSVGNNIHTFTPAQFNERYEKVKDND